MVEKLDSPIRPVWPLSAGNRAYLEGQILKFSSKESPEIKNVPAPELLSVLDRAIETTAIFEEAARNRPKNIHPDTDVVWVLSAPGSYSPDFQTPAGKIRPGDKPKAQYLAFPWVKEMYRHRVRTGIALVHEITAKRTGKPVPEITQEDIKNYGPW